MGCGQGLIPAGLFRLFQTILVGPSAVERTSFRAAAAASLILLSACASKPAIEVRTVRVEVPVPVACVAIADVPERPGPLPPRPEDARQALDLAMAKILEYFGYADKADAVLRGCAE